jgi:hypothetical protein
MNATLKVLSDQDLTLYMEQAIIDSFLNRSNEIVNIISRTTKKYPLYASVIRITYWNMIREGKIIQISPNKISIN